MKTFKTDVVYKITQERKGKGLEMGNLYFKNVPVTFAQVLKAGKKYQSEDTAYQLNLFIDKETMTKVESIGLNKEFAEVGVTKIKKGANRGEFKYKLDEHNEGYVGMFGAQFSRNTLKRDKDGAVVKTYEPLKVVDVEGNPFDQEVGNGSVCTVKLFAYRNEEDMLVVMMDTVMVVEHIPYAGKGGDTFDEEMGVTIKSAVAKEKEEAKKVVEDLNVEANESAPTSSFDDDLPF